MHTVAVVALNGVIPFDLSTPCEVFGRVRLSNGKSPYRVKVCSVTSTVDTGYFSLRSPFGLRELSRADTIIVPGVSDLHVPVPRELVLALRAAAHRGARLASICTGAFILAAAGLLDGRPATTHWLAAAELQRRHPSIAVNADVLFVDDGPILTSAGAAAGLDLCLHLVRRDFGAAVAADVARASVMPLERAGGQAQFIKHEPPAVDGASLGPVLTWAAKHLNQPLELAHLAKRAAMSTRTFTRRFREQTGTTPLQWVVKARVTHAQHLLETTSQSIERIVEQTGFGSTAALRSRFHDLVGTSPQAYRRAFSSRR